MTCDCNCDKEFNFYCSCDCHAELVETKDTKCTNCGSVAYPCECMSFDFEDSFEDNLRIHNNDSETDAVLAEHEREAEHFREDEN